MCFTRVGRDGVDVEKDGWQSGFSDLKSFLSPNHIDYIFEHLQNSRNFSAFKINRYGFLYVPRMLLPFRQYMRGSYFKLKYRGSSRTFCVDKFQSAGNILKDAVNFELAGGYTEALMNPVYEGIYKALMKHLSSQVSLRMLNKIVIYQLASSLVQSIIFFYNTFVIKGVLSKLANVVGLILSLTNSLVSVVAMTAVSKYGKSVDEITHRLEELIKNKICHIVDKAETESLSSLNLDTLFDSGSDLLEVPQMPDKDTPIPMKDIPVMPEIEVDHNIYYDMTQWRSTIYEHDDERYVLLNRMIEPMMCNNFQWDFVTHPTNGLNNYCFWNAMFGHHTDAMGRKYWKTSTKTTFQLVKHQLRKCLDICQSVYSGYVNHVPLEHHQTFKELITNACVAESSFRPRNPINSFEQLFTELGKKVPMTLSSAILISACLGINVCILDTYYNPIAISMYAHLTDSPPDLQFLQFSDSHFSKVTLTYNGIVRPRTAVEYGNFIKRIFEGCEGFDLDIAFLLRIAANPTAHRWLYKEVNIDRTKELVSEEWEMPPVEEQLEDTETFKASAEESLLSGEATPQMATPDLVQLCVKFGTRLLAYVFAITDVCTNESLAGKSSMAKLRAFNSSRKETLSFANDISDSVKEIAYDVFGYYIGNDASLLHEVNTAIERINKWNDIPTRRFLADPALYYEALHETVNVVKLTTESKLPYTQQSVGTSNAIRTLAHMVVDLKKKLDEVRSLLLGATNRQVPLAILLFGLHGAGKSTYVQDHLIPALAKKLNLSPNTYTISFTSVEGFFTAYAGQAFAVKDEFMAKYDQDAIIDKLNAIHSPTGFNMEGADLSCKHQPCQFKVVFYISNSPYVDMRNSLTPAAARAMYSRFLTFEFVNLSAKEGIVRQNIEHREVDNEIYEYRFYPAGTGEHMANTPLYPVATDPATKKALFDNIKKEYKDKQVNGYQLLTHNQVVDLISGHYYKQTEIYHQSLALSLNRDFVAALKSYATIEDCIAHHVNVGMSEAELSRVACEHFTQLHKQHGADFENYLGLRYRITMQDKLLQTYLNGRGGGESEQSFSMVTSSDCDVLTSQTNTVSVGDSREGSYMTNIVTNILDRVNILPKYEIQQQRSTADHFVVCITGDGGSGKTYLAQKLAVTLAAAMNRKAYAVNKITETTLTLFREPCVVVLNDAIYDEEAYVNFYDSLPAPSIILNTNNLQLKPRKVKSGEILQGSDNVPEMATTDDTSQSWSAWAVRKLMFFTSLAGTSWSFDVFNPLTKQMVQHPGFVRRLGIPGNFIVNGSITERPPNNSLLLLSKARRFFAYTGKCGEGRFVQKNWPHLKEMVSDDIFNYVLSKMQSYTVSMNNIKVVQCVDEKDFDQYKLPSYDLDLSSPTLQDLIDGTRSFNTKVGAALKTNKKFNLKLSERVTSYEFMFDPGAFAIPANPTLFQIPDIAKQLYQFYTQVDPSFTIKVETKELKIIGNKQVLYYLSETNIPVRHFEVSQELLRVVAGDKTLATFPTDIVAKSIVCGFDHADMLTYAPLDQVIFLYNNLDRLKQNSYLDKRISYYETRIHTVNIHRSMMTSFLQYISDAVDSTKSTFSRIAWVIVIFLMSAATLTFICCIFKTIFKLFKKETDIELIISFDTVQVPVRTQFEQKNNEIRVIEAWIDRQEFDDICSECCISEIESKIKEKLIDFLHFTKNPCKYTLDTDFVLHTDGSKKDTDDYHTDRNKNNARTRGKKMNVRQRNFTDLKKSKPHSFELDASFTDIQQTLYDEHVFPIYRDGIFRSYAICFAQKFLIANRHLYHSKDDKFKLIWKDKPYDVIPILEDPISDLLILQVDDKTFPNRRNIINWFATQEDLDSCSSSLFKSYSTNLTTTADACSSQLSYDFTNPAHPDWRLKAGSDIIFSNVVQSENLSRPGDCGLPLFIRGGKRPCKIGGIHMAASTGCLYAAAVERELLQSIFDKQNLNESEFQTAEEIPFEEFNVFEIPQPDGTATEISFFPQTEQILFDLVDARDQQAIDDLEQGSIKVIGYTKTCSRSWHLQPKFSPTLFTKDIPEIPNNSAPSCTKNAQLVDDSNLIKYDSKPSISLTQVKKINNCAKYTPLLKKYFDKAIKHVVPYYESTYGQFKHRFLTKMEAINGLIMNPRDKLFGCLDSVNRDGSVGIELQKEFKIQITRDLLESVEEEMNKGPTACTRYSFKKKYEKHINSLIQQQWLMATSGHRFESFIQDNLKVELRPKEKVEVGNTRLFNSFSFITMYNMRRLFGTIMAAFKKQHSEAYSQIGISPASMHYAAQRLRKTSPHVICGDYKNFDKSITKEEMQAVQHILMKIFLASNKNIDQEQLSNLFSTFFDMIHNAISVCDGITYVTTNGNKSGNPITTLINCIVNHLRHVTIFLYLIDQHNVKLRINRKEYINTLRDNSDKSLIPFFQDFQNLIFKPIGANTDTFKHYCDMLTYGDDVIIAVRPELLSIFNFLTISKVFKEQMNVIYTSSNKTDTNPPPFTSLDGSEFMSRTFQNVNGINVAKLKIISIDHQFHWISSHSLEQYNANLRNAFSELALWGEDIFNKYKQIYEQKIRPVLQNKFKFLIRQIYSPPLYETLFQEKLDEILCSQYCTNSIDELVSDNFQFIFESDLNKSSPHNNNIIVDYTDFFNKKWYIKTRPHKNKPLRESLSDNRQDVEKSYRPKAQ